MKDLIRSRPAWAVAFLAIAALGLGLFSATSASADGPTIGITSEEINLEGEGKVTLWGDKFGEPGLGAWTIDVHYNADRVNIVECGAEAGGICNPAFGDNAARITGSVAEGRTGEFALGSLWFTCKGEGESNLELVIKVLADGTLGAPQAIEAKIVHGVIYCFEEKHERLLGDADCNGEVTSLDASWILQFSAALVEAVPCPDLADVNGDGHVNAVDSTIVLKKVAGLL